MSPHSRFRDGLPQLEVDRRRDPVLSGHVHPHLELNYLFAGSIRYRLAGRACAVPSRRWSLLWAALPHAIEECRPGTDILALAVPVGVAQAWQGTGPLLRRLMRGELAVLPPDAADAPLAQRWCREATDQARRAMTLLEIEALVRRAALSCSDAGPAESADDAAHPLSPAFGEMIAILHRDPARTPSLPALARMVGLRPDTASRLFRRHAGCSLRAYLQRVRVGEARRLLLETALPIIEVALRCGYQSLSRFYAAYALVFNEAPAACRRRRSA